MTQKVAVVLAGAVARGAFEAGALDVLASRDVQIARIVAASAGALNATVLARGVCEGNVASSTARLVRLWENEATLDGVFDINIGDALRFRGISDRSKLLQLLESNVTPCAVRGRVEVRFIVASLGGVEGNIGSQPATTHELSFRFDETHFSSSEGLARVFDAATASSSFPIAFAPAELGAPYGPCVDGGAVNNTPLKYAMGDDITAAVVIASSPQNVKAPASRSGLDLLGDLADVLIDERLYRDLREAHDVNRCLDNLERLNLQGGDLKRVKEALGWTGRRSIDIVSIRPPGVLPGNIFSGFTSKNLRKQYVSLGRDAATQALGDKWRVG